MGGTAFAAAHGSADAVAHFPLVCASIDAHTVVGVADYSAGCLAYQEGDFSDFRFFALDEFGSLFKPDFEFNASKAVHRGNIGVDQIHGLDFGEVLPVLSGFPVEDFVAGTSDVVEGTAGSSPQGFGTGPVVAQNLRHIQDDHVNFKTRLNLFLSFIGVVGNLQIPHGESGGNARRHQCLGETEGVVV